MINEKIKMVLWYLKDKINVKSVAVIVAILFLLMIFYKTTVSFNNLQKELQEIQKKLPSEEEKKLLELKNKYEDARKKIIDAENRKKEAEEDMKKYKNFEDCYLWQIDRVVTWKETLLEYCEKNFNTMSSDEFHIIPKASADFEGTWKIRWFTDYDLGDVFQNDSEPCVWASGKDLCKMHKAWIKTIALVNIKRWELWINFGDKVKLSWWPCEGIYEVHDEMAERFRQKKGIYKPWTNYEIRGDIARIDKNVKCSWAYQIEKI